jgi:hypothetical protein
MSDDFQNHAPGLESPAERLADVTPDDGTDLAWSTRAIAVTGAGTVRVTTVAGDTGTIYVAAGAPFPIRAQRVWATGTTATGIVALA